ncbi:hypothetical protein [Paraburkholderia youngii]|uniref:hypothetical protein n=1 Tax=Paraburkholderia youngii TaxID=2782701 RepID=UPI003D22FE76
MIAIADAIDQIIAALDFQANVGKRRDEVSSHDIIAYQGTASEGVQFLEPVFGIAAASLMFGDRVGPSFVVGVALVLAGLALTMVSRNEVGNRARNGNVR